MMRGVRRPEEARALGLSRRMMVRLGALLKKRMAVTAAVLEAAKPDTSLEALLLAPAFLQDAEGFDETGAKQLLRQHLGGEAEAYVFDVSDDGFRVLCLVEELEADGWETETSARGASAADDVREGASETRSLSLTSSQAGAFSARGLVRQSGEGGYAGGPGEALFSNSELGRLRLKALTAAHAGERIEALRILVHAPLPDREKAEILFQAVSDQDPYVRGEAASLLVVLGVPDGVAESLKALTNENQEVQVRGALRLAKGLSNGASDLELAAVASAALAALKTAQDFAYVSSLFSLLGYCGPALARTPERLAELVRAMLDKVFHAEARGGTSQREASKAFTAAQHLLRALHEAAPEMLVEILLQERTKVTADQDDAFLLQLLLDFLPVGGEGEAGLLRLCASFLAKDTRESRDSRALGMGLSQRGETALHALIDVFPDATVGARKYFLRLFDDMVRYQKLSEDATERAGGVLLQALESGAKGLRVAALGARLVADPQLSEALRAKLAHAFLASISDLSFKSDLEIAEDHVAHIGLPAIPALLARLEPERPVSARVQAVRILGNLVRYLRLPVGQMRRVVETVTDLLRRLQALSAELDFPGRHELHAAMGKIVASPAASKEAGDVVSRNLLQAALQEEGVVGHGLLEGLAWVAASRRADAQFMTTVSGLLRRCMNGVQSEVSAVEREIDGQRVLEFSSGDDFVEVLPVAITGLSWIASSSSCPSGLRGELIKDLVGRWQDLASGKLVWGPANVTLVVGGLREMGCCKEVGHESRMLILKALTPRLIQTSVMHAVTHILQASDTPRLCRAALTIGQAILNRRDREGRFDSEDRPEILKALARVVGRKYLGSNEEPAAAHFRDAVLEQLYQGAQDRVSGAYSALIEIRDAGVLDDERQQELERRLSKFHSIVKGEKM